jgi:hypothetical protein
VNTQNVSRNLAEGGFFCMSVLFLRNVKKTMICMMVFWLFKKMCTFLFPLPIPEEEMFVKCYVRVLVCEEWIITNRCLEGKNKNTYGRNS